MKVFELIEILSRFDPKLPIVLSGSEGGAQYPRSVSEVEVMFDVNINPACGPHEIYKAEFDYQSPDSPAIFIE